jgi:hypothetical protein
MDECLSVTDAGLGAIADACRNLRVRAEGGWRKEGEEIGEEGAFVAFLGCLTHLLPPSLTLSTLYSAPLPAPLPPPCTLIQVLSVRRCTKLSDDALALVASLGCLQQLMASGVGGCGNKTMLALSQHCRESLELLDVSFCRGVSERALGLVADSCPHLCQMVIFGCSQVTFWGGSLGDLWLLTGHSRP